MTPWDGPGPTDRVLVVAPHPDDETLAAGTLLQRASRRGATVRVLVATDGEANVWVERLVERRWRLTPAARAAFAARRRAEATEALARLGVPAGQVRFLGLPDDGICDRLEAADGAGAGLFAREIGEFRPDLLVLPALEDLHPDHGALGILARLALDRLGPGRAPSRSLEYVVHGPRRGDLVLEPDAAERATQRAAIACHRAPMRAHARDFLARAVAPERFREARPDVAGRTNAPVRRVRRLADGGLLVEVGARPRLGAFGPQTLHLVACSDGTVVGALRVPLAWGRGASDATDVLGRSVGRARLLVRGSRRVAILPPECVTSRGRLFVKVERRHGFYDEGGWTEVAVAPSATSSLPSDVAGEGVVAVVPCFDVATLCGPVVREAARWARRVVAVDDGSRDGTGAVLRAEAAHDARIEVLAFPQNRGKGAALVAAFRRALETPGSEVVVTVDGDGQHRPADIPALAAACREGADLAIGGRRFTGSVPLRSRLGNTVTALVLRRLFPRCPADTQSGLRAHRRGLVAQVVDHVEGRRYETELDILLLALSTRRRVVSVPIPALYFDRNRSSHFQPLRDSWRIYRALADWIRRHPRFDRGAAPRPPAAPLRLAAAGPAPVRVAAGSATGSAP